MNTLPPPIAVTNNRSYESPTMVVIEMEIENAILDSLNLDSLNLDSEEVC
jgi:hypothetical protein